ncbi:PepSY-associated TM helix domain-containing protein [uncultured Psychrosphaera sp.]|uniref:PepSY-associated TM helix domain-containing protein n=1 Tax=uncultured Psychrosphaera sp. TaxID=1403522 RepID=UPI0030FCE089
MAIKINWFKLNRSLHRDIGYFCIGLTLIFAISGIALNHVDDWNPNYQVTQQQHFIPDINTKIDNDDFESWLLSELKLDTSVKARFWESPKKYKIFTKHNHTLLIDTQKNNVVIEQITPRFLLKSFNFLHLNEAKSAWTYFSDLYAAMLIYLALSALFMVKGKNGVKSLRGLLVLAGFCVPAAFVIIYSY